MAGFAWTRFGRTRWAIALVVTGAMAGLLHHGAPQARADDVMEALQAVQEIVGDWEGADGRDEKMTCAWKFNKKTGKTSLYLKFAGIGDKGDQRLLEEGMITYDANKKVYLMKAYRVDGDEEEVLEFEGKPKTSRNLIFERIKKGDAKDNIDVVDIKLLNDGDRFVYTIQKRIGKSKRTQKVQLVGLNRQGASLAAAGNTGPKCIVTGGAGTMTVSYKGGTYYVCCTGCRETFLDSPEVFIAKAEKAGK